MKKYIEKAGIILLFIFVVCCSVTIGEIIAHDKQRQHEQISFEETEESIQSESIGDRINIIEEDQQAINNYILLLEDRINRIEKYIEYTEKIKSSTDEYSEPNY